MYKAFFNLTKKPFDLLPDPDFLFMSSSHKKALSYLDYGIKERAGFILLTGEVGSGKTTLIRDLIKKNHANVILSKIFNTKVDSEQLIAMINDDFGLPVRNKDKITLLRELNVFLIEQFVKGNHPVLIIDEAQNLDHNLLEEIRMLSNLETDNAKLLQIILVGQPELRKTLASENLLQLRQRISINCSIQPLSQAEIARYILHRLEKAGDRNAAVFAPESIDIIFAYSRGIPRLINIICDFILLAAFSEGTRTIDAALVRDIVGDLDFEQHYWSGDETATPPIRTARAFSTMIKNIHDRLDILERGTGTAIQKQLRDVTAKISELEASVKVHQERIFTSESLMETEKSGMFPQEQSSLMGTMFGRMFKL